MMRWNFLFLILMLNAGYLTSGTKLEHFLIEAASKFQPQMARDLTSVALNDKFSAISYPPCSTSVLDFNISTSETNVTGLGNFNVSQVSYDSTSMLVKIIFTFREIRLKGNYDVNGHSLFVVPIYGRGNYDVRIINSTVTLPGRISPYHNQLKLIIDSNTLTFYDVNYKVKFTKFLGGGTIFSLLTKKPLILLGKVVFDLNKRDIVEELERYLVKAFNLELSKIQ